MSAQVVRRLRINPSPTREEIAPDPSQRRAAARAVPMELVPHPATEDVDQSEELRRLNREAGRLQSRQAALRDIDQLLAQTAGLLERARETSSIGVRDEARVIAQIALRDVDRRARAAGLADASSGGVVDRAALGLSGLDVASDEGIALASPLLLVARGNVRNLIDRVARELDQLALQIPRAPLAATANA